MILYKYILTEIILMQELSNAMIEFFDLVIEKYITHFANPKREWNYFKSLL